MVTWEGALARACIPRRDAIRGRKVTPLLRNRLLQLTSLVMVESNDFAGMLSRSRAAKARLHSLIEIAAAMEGLRMAWNILGRTDGDQENSGSSGQFRYILHSLFAVLASSNSSNPVALPERIRGHFLVWPTKCYTSYFWISTGHDSHTPARIYWISPTWPSGSWRCLTHSSFGRRRRPKKIFCARWGMLLA